MWSSRNVEPSDVFAPWKPPANPEMYKLDHTVKPANNTPAALMSSILSGFRVIYCLELD